MSFGGRMFSKSVVVDGIKFDSQMEANYYEELKKKERLGEISALRVHPSYPLQEGYTRLDGTNVKPINYEADFSYFDKYSVPHIVDVKGFATDDFILKWKMFDFIYGEKSKVNLEVIKYSKTTGWVSFEKYKEVMKSNRKKLIDEKNNYKQALARLKVLRGRITKLDSQASLTACQEANKAKWEQEIVDIEQGNNNHGK